MALKDDGQVSDSACFASGWYDDIFEKVIKMICEARYIVPKNVNTIRYLRLLFKVLIFKVLKGLYFTNWQNSLKFCLQRFYILESLEKDVL